MSGLRKILIYLLLILCSGVFLIPLGWMISTGLKPIEQTMSMPPTWIPYKEFAPIDGRMTEVRRGEAVGTSHVKVNPVSSARNDWRTVPTASLTRTIAPRWENFRLAIQAMKCFPRYLGNTVLLCILTVIGTVISSAMAAYGFARIEWIGRDKVFLLALATMMIPFPVVMVPLYCLFRWIGWIGTLKPLWVGSFFAGAFNVFLLRQFFMTLPKDLTEAARIDGCSEFRIFWQIILPLSRPSLMVVGLFQFMATWNDFLGPLIYLTDQKDFTLALGLQFFQSQSGGTEWHYLMAASTLVAAPILILFFFTQKTFIEGISMSGIKG
jgi:multiple sugar transport system permease protein